MLDRRDTMSRRPLSVIVTDDHPLMVEAIAGVVSRTRHTLVGSCTNSRALLQLLASEPVDVITLDIGMPGLNGIDLARQISTNRPSIKIVIVSQQADATYVHAAFAAGASAFVAKHSSTQDLADALDANRLLVELYGLGCNEESACDFLRRLAFSHKLKPTPES